VLLGNANGDGHLQQSATSYTVGSGPASLAIADLDSNNTPDLAVANNGSNDVSVLLGTGSGSFTAAGPYGAGSGPYSLAVLSPSGDSKPDLVVANAYSNNVSVLLNTTSDATPGSTTQTASGGSSVTTDPTGAGATADVPVQTQVTLPSGLPATTVSITAETSSNWHPPNPCFAKQVVIDVGGAIAAQSNPFLVSFTLDSSLLCAVLPADVQISRDDVGLSACTDPVAAIPDACIASQAVGPGGDAVLTVRTTHFSRWNFGRLDYAFGGFLQPVDPLPTVNTMKAGSAVPVKFSLGGNKGLNIFQPGYPAQGAYGCDSSPTDQIEQTVMAGGSSLSYDATSNTYTYVWKTDKTWAATCRELVLKLRDGTTQKARFQISK
jgi:hypothetical protein